MHGENLKLIGYNMFSVVLRKLKLRIRKLSLSMLNLLNVRYKKGQENPILCHIRQVQNSCKIHAT